MGTPIEPPLVIDPVSAGDPCKIGWGVGKKFGDDDTPESIAVNFSGMNSDSIPPATMNFLNDAFVLHQKEFSPCVYDLLVSGYFFEIRWQASDSRCLLIADYGGLGAILFVEFTTQVAQTEFSNQAVLNPLGGTAYVHIPEVE